MLELQIHMLFTFFNSVYIAHAQKIIIALNYLQVHRLDQPIKIRDRDELNDNLQYSRMCRIGRIYLYNFSPPAQV